MVARAKPKKKPVPKRAVKAAPKKAAAPKTATPKAAPKSNGDAREPKHHNEILLIADAGFETSSLVRNAILDAIRSTRKQQTQGQVIEHVLANFKRPRSSDLTYGFIRDHIRTMRNMGVLSFK